MPKAKSSVPTPTTPPKHHPTATTVSSMALRTHAMGRFVLLCKPVINPSLGPGPRLAIRYNPPPKPVTVTPTIPSIIFKPSWSNSGRYGRELSRTKAIMIMFSAVPRPGVCLSGIQSNKTHILITNVAKPTLHPVTFVTPCANTVQGLTPTPDAIKRASPRPNKIRPKTKTTAEIIGGRIVRALGELQNSFGTAFTAKNLSLNFITEQTPQESTNFGAFFCAIAGYTQISHP